MSILNFGSLNIDFVYDVDQFVRKGQTISSASLNVFSGGKGLNQSLALARAGADVCHAGMIGADGVFLRDLLAEAGVDVSNVAVNDVVRTGNAIIQRDTAGDNCIILYGGTNRAITREFVDAVLARFRAGDWLLLQNEISELPYIVRSAASKGMRIVLNPSPADASVCEVDLDAIDCFILNEGEAEYLCGSHGSPHDLLRAMRAQFPKADIVLTVGDEGSMMAQGNEVFRQKAYHVPVVDTTAAGDTFTGYLLGGLMSDRSAAESLDAAAKASAIAVSRAGAAPSIPAACEVQSFEIADGYLCTKPPCVQLE